MTSPFTAFCLFVYLIEQIDPMLLWVCTVTVIDYRRCQNAVGTSVTHSAAPCVLIVLFLPHFGITYDLLLNRCTTRGVCLLKSGHMYLKGRHIHTLCLQIQLLRFCKLCVLHCHLFQERKQETEFSNPLHLEIQDCKKSMNHQFFNNQEMKHTVPWPKSSNLQN